MSSGHDSIIDGLLLGSTIIFWSFALDWFASRFPRFGRFAYPSALPLIKDGQIMRKNLRKEMLTEEELMADVRQQCIDDLARVKDAFMEFNGLISVIPRDSQAQESPDARATEPALDSTSSPRL